MIFRGLFYGLLIVIPFWVLVAVGLAKAEPAATPAPYSLQAQADATAAWLSATLHADVPAREVFVAGYLEDNHAGEFWPDTTHIIVRGWVAHSLTTSSWADASAAQVLVHESLHRADTYPCWYGPDGFRVEEGIVDAVTSDLMPAWYWRFWNMSSIRPVPAYTAEVAAVRAWSARYTGSRTWRTRAARTARRVLWGASCEERAALLSSPTTEVSYER